MKMTFTVMVLLGCGVVVRCSMRTHAAKRVFKDVVIIWE